MDFHESIDQARDHIGKAKAAYCLCNYDEALALLIKTYSNVRGLLDHVFQVRSSADLPERPAGEDS